MTCLFRGGENDAGLLELLQDFKFGEEFLVMIVEYLPGEKRHGVNVHKITRVGLNWSIARSARVLPSQVRGR